MSGIKAPLSTYNKFRPGNYLVARTPIYAGSSAGACFMRKKPL